VCPTRISVVIPTYNRSDKLKATIDHLLQDDYPDMEIIIADGGSTDGTVDLLQSYGKKISYFSEPDRGEFDARNKGLLRVSGEIIRYLNDDDVPIKGAFTIAADYFKANPEVQILFGQGDLYYSRMNEKPILIQERKCDNRSLKKKNWLRNDLPTPFSEAAFFKKSVLDKAGMFDVNFPGADRLFWLKAANEDVKMAMTNDKFINYINSETSGMETRKLGLIRQGFILAARYGSIGDVINVTLSRSLPALIRYFLKKITKIFGLESLIIKRKINKLNSI